MESSYYRSNSGFNKGMQKQQQQQQKQMVMPNPSSSAGNYYDPHPQNQKPANFKSDTADDSEILVLYTFEESIDDRAANYISYIRSKSFDK
ncbi:hypothetical protein O6P43_023557 [Quillaja saponaria]|uniref:Uncharacterized protein n=1 Tax=Quillaja saponaria TaxID=32244 RepID=A0AAD7LFH3_QUISA|nr:hypothetical protein O6P43_023557 [Quillaja saponaria]